MDFVVGLVGFARARSLRNKSLREAPTAASNLITVEMSCKYWKHHFLQFLMSLPNVAPRHSHMNVVIQQKLFQCFTIREFEHISDFEVWPISKSCFSMPILHSVYSLGAKHLHQIISEGCGGGQVVSVIAFYSNDRSLNPAEAYNFFCKIVFETNKNKQKRGRVDPLFKK